MNTSQMSDEVNESFINAEEKILEVLDLIYNSRYLVAKEKYYDLINFIDKESELLIQHKDIIDDMLSKCSEIEISINVTDIDSSWIFGIRYFGITTHYRKVDDGSILLRLEGTLEDLPLFEQCSVIHEVDLYKHWIPFCKDSLIIEKIGQAELVAYLFLGIVPMTRDTLIKAYGADCLTEHNKVVILGHSIPNWESPKSSSIPFRQRGWFHDRFELHDFAAIFSILSPSTAKTIITARVDLHALLPQNIINFLVRNIAGIGLYVFQQQALKVSREIDCIHNERIREDKEFYMDWILPKLKNYCNLKGWPVPEIKAFS